MAKRITAVIVTALILSVFAPFTISAAEDLTTYKLLASDDFSKYKFSNGAPANTGRTTFGNFPESGASMVNGGEGWGSAWSPSNTNFATKFTEGIPFFEDVGIQLVYHYGSNLYRKLNSSVSADIDNEIYIKFAMACQTISNGNAVGISLFDDKVRFGLSANGVDTDNNITDKTKYPNYPVIVANGQPTLCLDKEIGQGNGINNYVAKITLNSSGPDTLQLKVFPKSAAEPAEWDVEVSAELSDSVLSFIGLLCFGYGTLWENVSIHQKNIALSTEIGSTNNEENLSRLTDGVKTANVSVKGFFIDLAAKYSISDISLFMDETGYSGFSIYGANNSDMSDGVLLAEQTDPLSGNIFKASSLRDSSFQYVFFVGDGSNYKIAEIVIGGKFVVRIFEATLRSVSDSRIFDGDFIADWAERLYIHFGEPINESTINGAISLKYENGSTAPVEFRYNPTTYVVAVHLKDVLNDNEKYTLSVSTELKNTAGKQLDKPFNCNFYGKRNTRYSLRAVSAVGSNSYLRADVYNDSKNPIDVTYIGAVTSGGNIVRLHSSAKTAVPANGTVMISNTVAKIGDGDINNGFFIKDFTSFAPMSETASVTDQIVIDEITTNDYEVTVKGKVRTSEGVLINGRDVIVGLVKKDGLLPTASGNIITNVINLGMANTDTANGEGVFSAKIKMTDGLPSGTYKAYAGTNYAAAPVSSNYFFMLGQRSIELVNLYNGISAGDTAAMNSLLMTTASELDINYTERSGEITDMTRVCQRLIGKNFTSALEIMKAAQEAFTVEGINQAPTAAAASNIVKKYAAETNISLVKLTALEKAMPDVPTGTAYVTRLWNSIHANNFTDLNDFKDKFDKELDILLQERHPIGKLTLSLSGSTFNVGQAIDISVLTSSAASASFGEFKISYDSSLLTFIGLDKAVAFDNAIIDSSTAGSINIKLTEPAGKNTYSFANGEILKLKFTQKNTGALSTSLSFKADVNAYDQLMQTDRAFYYDLNSQITVSQGDGINSRPQTGGSSGGGGGGSGIITPQPTPTEQPKPTIQFTDLENVQWAEKAISFLAEKEVISGIGDNLFAPNQSVKREEFVKMLVGAFKIETTDAECSFSDVDVNAWYYSYVAGAVKSNIVMGYEDGSFGVGDYITREQMAALAYRTIKYYAPNTTIPTDFSFLDSDDISDWANESVGAVVNAGVMNGIGGNMFDPKNQTTRAQAAQVIYNILKLFDKSIV